MAITHAWHDLVHDMRDEVHDIATIGRADAARQAYLGLWGTMVLMPLLFGLDKLAGFMTDGWEAYLATWMNDILPGSASDAMIWFGVIEIVLAVAVLVAPRVGGDLLALWMLLAAISLFSLDGMVHLGIGACALAISALCMARLSRTYHHTEG
jgi:hypothetical protein